MTDQEPQRKKGGRPRKHSPEAKRPSMSFRISSELHSNLVEASSRSERSLSEEIERRLEETFRNPCSDDSPTAILLRSIASVIKLMETSTGKSWNEDEITEGLCGDLAVSVIRALMPERPPLVNRLLPPDPVTEAAKAEEWSRVRSRIAGSEVLAELTNARDRSTSGLAEKIEATEG